MKILNCGGGGRSMVGEDLGRGEVGEGSKGEGVVEPERAGEKGVVRGPLERGIRRSPGSRKGSLLERVRRLPR